MQGIGNNTKTPKEAYKRIPAINQSHNGQNEERLNLSVDIAQRHHMGGGGQMMHGGNNSTRNNSSVGYKKHSQQRDFNMRMNRINEEKLNNSVHEFNLHKKQNSNGQELSLHELSFHQNHMS